VDSLIKLMEIIMSRLLDGIR